MKTSKYIIFIGIFLLCISCKKNVSDSEDLEISIQNRTADIIGVTLFPKEEYTRGGFYRMSDFGGGYLLPEFNLSPNNDAWYNWDEVIFVTRDLSIKPYMLASKIFDSIHISLKDNVTLKFTHENVTGYSENIFSENSTWDFRIERRYSKNPVNIHRYTFAISEDKIIIEELSF